jgi:hypothetical protein
MQVKAQQPEKGSFQVTRAPNAAQGTWSATITLLPDLSSCEYKTHRESGETEIPIFPLVSGNSSVKSRIERVRPVTIRWARIAAG